MPATKCVLTGGAFQDAEGNVLANGYLTMTLSQDSSVSGVGNIAAGITITITLDTNGNVAGSPAQAVWGNDVLSGNTFYSVTGYTLAGQPAYGPNNQQVVGSTFNVGTWVPNQVISWSPSVQSTLLETNGTKNGSQATLNLAAGANITLADNGSGTITIAAAAGGSSFSVTNQGFFIASGMTDLASAFVGTFIAPITDYSANEVMVNQFVLQSAWTLSSVSYQLTTTSSGGSNFSFGIYSAAGVKLIDSGAFDGTSSAVQTLSFTPVTLPAGVYYFAASATDLTMRGIAMQTANPAVMLATISTSYPYIATAANATSGGVMPATLGTLTAILTAASWEGIPLCIWKV
jgi:hypothetical protein